MIAATPALATNPAGTVLPNTASITYSVNGQASAAQSNMAAVRVDEVLDLDLGSPVTTLALTGSLQTAVPFTLTNAGNGQEAFALSGTLNGISGTIDGYAIDIDGDGKYDPAVDQLLGADAVTPLLAPGTVIKFLALVRGSSNAGSGALIVDARAVTGSGKPGTDFAGKGDGGCDAVVGATTASARASVTLTIAAGDPGQISLVKSQSVVAPNGSSDPVKGATVTYTIESRFGGSGAVRDARLADAIPVGTTFVPGSLRLDGAALTDAAGDDAGTFDGTAIRVSLGDVNGPAVRTIQFQVKIK